jgi:hypothetical protein
MSLIVEPETTREQLTEAIANVNALAKRTPAHFADEHAKWHRQIDLLLTQLEATP